VSGVPSPLGIILSLSLLLWQAADAAETSQSIGDGANLCAQYSKAYADNPAGAEDMYWRWAMGMMSGLNFASVANSNVFRDLTGDQDIFRRAIRSYCNAHPLMTYGGAVLDLYVSLPLKKTNAK
jgi:hypothetical protein